MAGQKLAEMGLPDPTRELGRFCVKEAVMPFGRFPGADSVLGPEMKSTGEVMGIDKDFGRAYIKSQIAAGQNLPKKGNVFISVRDRDKRSVVFIAKKLKDLGFNIYSTSGTAAALEKNGIEVKQLPKVAEGRPNVLDLMKDGKIQMVINTPTGRIPRQDEIKIRSHVILYNIPYTTTISGAQATVNGIEMLIKKELDVKSLQEYHKKGARAKKSKSVKK
jgi:carbamoyl-phosphate synthase large subunit